MDAATVPNPPAILWEARKRKSRRGKTALAVGMIIILADGRECRIVGFTRDGTPLCHFPRE